MKKLSATLWRSAFPPCPAVPFLRDAQAFLWALRFSERLPGASWEPICSRAEPTQMPRGGCERRFQHMFTWDAQVLSNQAREQLTLWPALILTSVPLVPARTVKAGSQSAALEINALMLVFNCQKDTVKKPTWKPVTGEGKKLLSKPRHVQGCACSVQQGDEDSVWGRGCEHFSTDCSSERMHSMVEFML